MASFQVQAVDEGTFGVFGTYVLPGLSRHIEVWCLKGIFVVVNMIPLDVS